MTGLRLYPQTGSRFVWFPPICGDRGSSRLPTLARPFECWQRGAAGTALVKKGLGQLRVASA